MKISYYDDPCPHYIIDDFLNPRSARKVLQECIDLEPYYEQAKVHGDGIEAPLPDHCKICKLYFENFRDAARDNQTVGLDGLFKGKRNISPTLRYLHGQILSEQFKMFAKTSKSMFPILNQVNTSESLISRYGKCDFYGWHTDSINGITEKRIVTISYYVNKEPLNFKGGNLLLLYPNGKDYKEIIPKHNRAVIFNSKDAMHSVQYVDLTGKEWDEGRFSVQFWLGFNGPFKFR